MRRKVENRNHEHDQTQQQKIGPRPPGNLPWWVPYLWRFLLVAAPSLGSCNTEQNHKVDLSVHLELSYK